MLNHDFKIPELKTTIMWLQKIYDRTLLLRQNPFFISAFIGDRECDKMFADIVIRMMGRPIVQNDMYEAQIKVLTTSIWITILQSVVFCTYYDI